MSRRRRNRKPFQKAWTKQNHSQQTHFNNQLVDQGKSTSWSALQHFRPKQMIALKSRQECAELNLCTFACLQPSLPHPCRKLCHKLD
eukprot:1158048-Pelagomonas_calceolata.AAC.17